MQWQQHKQAQNIRNTHTLHPHGQVQQKSFPQTTNQKHWNVLHFKHTTPRLIQHDHHTKHTTKQHKQHGQYIWTGKTFKAFFQFTGKCTKDTWQPFLLLAFPVIFLWFSNEFVSFCLSFVRLVLCFCNGFGLTLHAGRCAWEAFAYQQLFCSSPHQWRSRFFLDLHTKPMKGQTTFSLSLSQFTFGGLCGRAPPWRFRFCFNEPPES